MIVTIVRTSAGDRPCEGTRPVAIAKSIHAMVNKYNLIVLGWTDTALIAMVQFICFVVLINTLFLNIIHKRRSP